MNVSVQGRVGGVELKTTKGGKQFQRFQLIQESDKGFISTVYADNWNGKNVSPGMKIKGIGRVNAWAGKNGGAGLNLALFEIEETKG